MCNRAYLSSGYCLGLSHLVLGLVLQELRPADWQRGSTTQISLPISISLQGIWNSDGTRLGSFYLRGVPALLVYDINSNVPMTWRSFSCTLRQDTATFPNQTCTYEHMGLYVLIRGFRFSSPCATLINKPYTQHNKLQANPASPPQ